MLELSAIPAEARGRDAHVGGEYFVCGVGSGAGRIGVGFVAVAKGACGVGLDSVW